MNIVIIGAGDIGLHVAKVFSELQYGTILIDKNPYKLELAERDLDIATRTGNASDWELLQELLEISPDLLVALTDQDETNLVSSQIAKNLNYPQTIARVRNPKYLMQSRLHFEKLFSVDHLIGPEKLTARALADMLLFPGAIGVESFSQGSVQMRTLKLPSTWGKKQIPLKDRSKLHLPEELMVALIRRGEEIIFPHGDDQLFPNDEVSFIGETTAINKLYDFIDLRFHKPSSVVILGGSLTGIELAKILHTFNIAVTVVDKSPAKCQSLSEKLPFATILQHEALNFSFLENEKILANDRIVIATNNDETNFLLASILKDSGADKVFTSLSDTRLASLMSKMGISHVASPRVNAANRILTIAREKKVAAMVSLYDNRAEVIEVKVSLESKIAGIPIRHLGPALPKDFLIAVIQSRGRIFIADGNRILSPGDTVIVITNPRHSEEIKKLF